MSGTASRSPCACFSARGEVKNPISVRENCDLEPGPSCSSPAVAEVDDQLATVRRDLESAAGRIETELAAHRREVERLREETALVEKLGAALDLATEKDTGVNASA
jgi:hypothetical protein